MAMRIYLFLLLLSFTAYGQQLERVAIINTVDDGDSIKFSELNYLTDRLREMAVNILPKQRYGVMTTESIVAFLGSEERVIKVCKESSCLADLGRKVNADYVAQARIGRFSGNLTIKTELYSSKSGVMVGSFTGNSKDMFGLLAFIDEKAPALFKKLPVTSEGTIRDIVNMGKAPLDFTDSRDGKKYRMAAIGAQIWMAENLNYNASGSRCYGEDGKIKSDNSWIGVNDYKQLSNAEIQDTCQKYGRLYNWLTAKFACPKDWHLPSDAEWGVLAAAVGGEKTAGKYLKATSGWRENGNGEDKYGFSALPGSLGSSNGVFPITGDFGVWWSASENSRVNAYYWFMSYNSHIVGHTDTGNSKDNLFSVRCVKD